MSNNVSNYKNMIANIYKTNLKYYAFAHFPREAEDLLGQTVEYFLDSYDVFQKSNYQQLEANMIMKIKNLRIDLIRTENSKSLIAEIIDPGDLEEIGKNIEKGNKLSIKEIKELNAQLEDNNLKKIIYRGVSQNISGSDDFGQSEIDKSQQLTDEDPLKNIKLKQAYDMVDQLGKKCSELIRAQVTKELKYKQIAKEFNMKMGTVMTNLSRCWKKLEELKNAK